MRIQAYLIGIGAVCATSGQAAETAISFNRHIRPILAANCLACHGPDQSQREADLRLDVRDIAIDVGALVPESPDESELVRRVYSEDPNQRMPPPRDQEPLSHSEKELLRRWVANGANYETHWAFVSPKRPALPAVRDTSWPRNAIDRFVLSRLEKEGLAPSPAADRYTLIRRLYLDLVGLPPTPSQVDAFVHDQTPDSYERLVDRLLQSKHYGERWARRWLDLARYADTNGYEKDRPRSIWPYRDWVIRAVNDDMPFDQFTIEQLAGDMLPNATPSQRIATGFHRNTMLNEEGGIDPLEFRFYAMVDRVATTGTVWLGLTTGCAQCHSHKYDPISHNDFYRLMALLNNADEPDLVIANTDVETRRRRILDQIAKREADLASQFPPIDGDGPIEQRRAKNLDTQFRQWLETAKSRAVAWTTLIPYRLRSNLPKLSLLEDGSILSSGDITKRDVFTLEFQLKDEQLPITAIRLEVLPDERLPARGPGRAYYEGRKGDFFLSELTATVDGREVQFKRASHSYGKISIGSGSADARNVIDGEGSTGWSTAQREGQAHELVVNLTEPLDVTGKLKIELLFERHFAASLGRFRFSTTSDTRSVTASALPELIQRILSREQGSWNDTDKSRLKQHFLRVTPRLAEARRAIDPLRRRLPAPVTTMVMSQRPPDNPRKTYRHHRGEYLRPREEVAPGVPAVFQQLPKDRPADRLALARWLVSPRNPLVGRVTVNRWWQVFFGAGLVRTSYDFGTQGDAPTHPKLLDYLARELADNGWSRKRLHKLIVMSATYRQSSRVSSGLLESDPENRLLARGSRFRVDAELIRDMMLSSSGLLSKKMYGPSVRPPQPASVTALAYGNPKWRASQGEDRYRRSIYSFIKRTAPFAAYAVFDAPSGERCMARRDRSNTPLQALTLLNDQMYIEMARALAANSRNPSSRVATATLIFRRLLARPPAPKELARLLDFQHRQQERLQSGQLRPAEICGDESATSEAASWVMVARAVMNLDEAITRQ